MVTGRCSNLRCGHCRGRCRAWPVATQRAAGSKRDRRVDVSRRACQRLSDGECAWGSRRQPGSAESVVAPRGGQDHGRTRCRRRWPHGTGSLFTITHPPVTSARAMATASRTMEAEPARTADGYGLRTSSGCALAVERWSCFAHDVLGRDARRSMPPARRATLTATVDTAHDFRAPPPRCQLERTARCWAWSPPSADGRALDDQFQGMDLAAPVRKRTTCRRDDLGCTLRTGAGLATTHTISREL